MCSNIQNKHLDLVNQQNYHGDTLLHLAIRSSQREGDSTDDVSAEVPHCLHWLLKSGADPCASSRSGITPIMEAAGIGDVSILKMLIAAGADAEQQDLRGYDAMFFAVEFGRVEALIVCLSLGCNACLG